MNIRTPIVSASRRSVLLGGLGLLAATAVGAQSDEDAGSAGVQALAVVRSAGAEISSGDSERFTGEVEIGPRFGAFSPSRLGGGLVRFDAGARTAWHAHPLGQTLYITEGCGWVQSEGGPVEVVGPGDIVQIPPNVRHWHGASVDEGMSHFAVLESLNSERVTWMEHVSEEDYGAGASSDGACSR